MRINPKAIQANPDLYENFVSVIKTAVTGTDPRDFMSTFGTGFRVATGMSAMDTDLGGSTKNLTYGEVFTPQFLRKARERLSVEGRESADLSNARLGDGLFYDQLLREASGRTPRSIISSREGLTQETLARLLNDTLSGEEGQFQMEDVFQRDFIESRILGGIESEGASPIRRDGGGSVIGGRQVIDAALTASGSAPTRTPQERSAEVEEEAVIVDDVTTPTSATRRTGSPPVRAVDPIGEVSDRVTRITEIPDGSLPTERAQDAVRQLGEFNALVATLMAQEADNYPIQQWIKDNYPQITKPNADMRDVLSLLEDQAGKNWDKSPDAIKRVSDSILDQYKLDRNQRAQTRATAQAVGQWREMGREDIGVLQGIVSDFNAMSPEDRRSAIESDRSRREISRVPVEVERFVVRAGTRQDQPSQMLLSVIEEAQRKGIDIDSGGPVDPALRKRYTDARNLIIALDMQEANAERRAQTQRNIAQAKADGTFRATADNFNAANRGRFFMNDQGEIIPVTVRDPLAEGQSVQVFREGDLPAVNPQGPAERQGGERISDYLRRTGRLRVGDEAITQIMADEEAGINPYLEATAGDRTLRPVVSSPQATVAPVAPPPPIAPIQTEPVIQPVETEAVSIGETFVPPVIEGTGVRTQSPAVLDYELARQAQATPVYRNIGGERPRYANPRYANTPISEVPRRVQGDVERQRRVAAGLPPIQSIEELREMEAARIRRQQEAVMRERQDRRQQRLAETDPLTTIMSDAP